MSKSSEQERDVELISDDIRLIVGGNFTPDGIGIEKYEGTLKRARARPRDYVRVFNSMYLGVEFDAVQQSNLYLPSCLEILAEKDPKAVGPRR